MERQITDLYTLLTAVRRGVEGALPSKVWLRAEISSLKARPGGHCYMDLSQSGPSGLTAKAQAIIWASKYRLLGQYFSSVTGMPLQNGITVLVLVQTSFSQLYGLSLIVDDIDPAYTLGEKERARRETIQRLRDEGLMDLQKGLTHAALPRTIAVISASDAAGYGDFMKHIGENPYGFRLDIRLFPALMQGSSCPGSIISAMEDILLSEIPFDMVLILRGGGSELDLSCFDDYTLCAAIARLPLPVYT
ncbi:MAG: exodeoxyribonuclease VII large subunit, partial [Clostridia bacterium]|nr:exodeoxyribonuclease VII large subunit [Clostridia bacterium]